MNKNKKSQLKGIKHTPILIILCLSPTIVVLLFICICLIVHKRLPFDISDWITLLISWISSTATILLGEIVLWQTHLYHDEEINNRVQELQIRTAPYFSLEGIDLIEHTTFTCESTEDNALFLDGEYNNGTNSGETFLLRFVIGCNQNKGLNNIRFRQMAFYTRFDGMKAQGETFLFSNNELMDRSEISFFGEDKYQFIVKLIFRSGEEGKIDVSQRLKSIKFETALLSGRTFININYTVSNFYGVSLDGELKMQCDIKRKDKDSYELTYLGNKSNWIDNPRFENRVKNG